MATASKSDKSAPRLQFMGPAAEEFETFLELAIFSLDNYWPNWRNYKEPASYIIPPMFSFKDHERSDFEYREREKEYQKFKATSKKPNLQPPDLVTKRRGDLGEFIVFEAITKCLKDEKFAPFLAIQGLEVKENKTRHFPQLFPEFGADILKEIQGATREHDFILIGKSIGILCIEVKSSTFSGQDDFSAKSNYLPDDIKSGIKQLNSFEKFLTSICQGLGIVCPPVSKFLFTPHLEKSRFDKWMDNLKNNLNSEVKKSVLDKIEDITIWFGNPASQTANSIDLYPTMIKVFNSSSRIPNGHYEKLGSLMAGLASVLVIRNNHNIALEISKLCEREAIVETAQLFDKLGKTRNVSDSAIFLTEDQNKAKKGPNRQFIFGTAGTGKTIVLRAKAQELLKDGKSVVVFGPVNILYGRKHFSFGGYQKCDIRWWMELIQFMFRNFVSEMIEIVKAILTNVNFNDLEICNMWIEKASLEKAKTWYDRLFSSFDAILIDDSSDDSVYSESHFGKSLGLQSLTCSIFIQVLSRIFSPSKVVWIAMDPSWVSDSSDQAEILNHITQYNTNKNLHSTVFLGTVILKRVMRCSEKVFNEAYYPILYRMKDKPLLGHKIPGSLELKEVVFHVASLDLESEGKKAFRSVAIAFEKLLDAGFHQSQIVIICGNCVDQFLSLAIDSLKEYVKRGRYSHLDITDSMVLGWNDVSSMEWPVVIYVSLIDWADRYEESVLYERYRACSRAQVKLIVIKGHFDHCKRSNEADIYSYLEHQIVKEANIPEYIDSQNRYKCIVTNLKGKEYRQLANMAATAETLVYFRWVQNQSAEELGMVARRRCHTIHAFNFTNRTFKGARAEYRMHRKFLSVAIRDSVLTCFHRMVKQVENDGDKRKTRETTNLETGLVIKNTANKLPNHLKDIFLVPIETTIVKFEELEAVIGQSGAKLDRISSINRIVNFLNSLPEETAVVYRQAIIRYCRILSTEYSHNSPIESNIENIIIPSVQSHPPDPCCYCCSII